MGTGYSEQTRLYLQSSGQCLLESEEGLELFDQLLSSQESSCLLIKGQRSAGVAEHDPVRPDNGGVTLAKQRIKVAANGCEAL